MSVTAQSSIALDELLAVQLLLGISGEIDHLTGEIVGFGQCLQICLRLVQAGLVLDAMNNPAEAHCELKIL